MIEIPINQAQIDVGDIQQQMEDGSTKPAKVMRITTQISFIVPMTEEAAQTIGNGLRGVNIVIAAPGDMPATPPPSPEK